MKNVVIGIGLALVLLMGFADAEMPGVGDYVTITQSVGILERQTYGTILDIDVPAGTLTLERDFVAQHSGFLNWTRADMPNENITIGMPTIIAMKEVIPPG